MSGRPWWEVPPHVAAADERLVESFEAAIGEGERRAWRHLACRLGWTACCIGPFDISALDTARRVAFFEAFADVPCPALDPGSGACTLYAWRPLSCRSFGLPVRCRSQLLPPCSLNFTGATEDETSWALVEPDPGDREGKLLAEAARCGTVPGETIVCAVLAQAHDS